MADGATQDVQNQNIPSQTTQAQEPMDIAQAFQMVRENQQAAAQPAQQEEPSVQEEAGAQAGSGGGEPQQPPISSGEGDSGYGYQPAPEPPVGGGAEGYGGPAAYQPQDDYALIQNNLIAALQQEAQRNVINKFRENNIKMMDVGDLYERREDGTVVFNNPDDPNRPFDTRADAQDWIDSMNKQIQNAYQAEVYKEQQNLYNSAAPAIDLIRFAPVYDAMDNATQDVFDELIEPYSIMNKNGDVIGFNCNLANMARQAMNIVSRYGIGQVNQQQQQQQVQQQPSQPAMDLKSGGGSSPDEKEPTNLAEAMAMLNKKEK